MNEKKVLISGGGIAGLTLAILLKEKGWYPQVIERAPALRTEGYMMDFAGSGWDVAERMGLVDDIMRGSSRIESWSYVGPGGSPRFPRPRSNESDGRLTANMHLSGVLTWSGSSTTGR